MEVIHPQLLLVSDLKPHELLIEEHSTQLLQDIIKDQAIYVPILVDIKTKVILDGHHRFSVAKKLHLAQIPCFVVDYFNENIVSVFPRRETVPVSKQLVIQAGLSGKLFPNKSTRHVLHISPVAMQYSLQLLINPNH